MTPRIQKAIDIFLDAINNGILAKGTCVACAVGNLVAAGVGGKISLTEGFFKEPQCTIPNLEWGSLFFTFNGVQLRNFQLFGNSISDYRADLAKSQIESTDFSLEELADIEFAFETNTKILIHNYGYSSTSEIKQDQINGLKAVIDVMLTFDDVKNVDIDEVFTSKIVMDDCV